MDEWNWEYLGLNELLPDRMYFCVRCTNDYSSHVASTIFTFHLSLLLVLIIIIIVVIVWVFEIWEPTDMFDK
jgi:hypothetical protein